MTSVPPPTPAASAGPEQGGRAVDHDVFIVHADDDTPFVRGELLPMLNLAGERVILSSELPFPAFTEQAIADSVQRSRLTITVVSPAYLRDRWAGFAELLSRNVDEDGRGGRLVPLLIADCEVPPILAQHATLDSRTAQQREAAAARLREWLGRPEPPAAPIACPYPGMRPFSAAMAARFHGREQEIESVLGQLHAGEREIYVIGPSGSGKSSLIAAGVLPRMPADDAGGERFAVLAMRPGEHPAHQLAETLGCEPTSFDGAISRLLERERRERLLIFVDQLEELFTLADADQRDRFVRALRVVRADRRCHLIAALRADFYSALMSSELWPDIEGRFARLEVAPLRGDALRRAIEAPAFEAEVYLERGLVERLISDAAAEPGALPLLQEALVLLWARRSHRLLRLASYEALDADLAAHAPGAQGAELRAGPDARPREVRSGIAVALARRADAALHDLATAEQRVAQRVLLRLVSFGEGRPDTRRQQPRAGLAACGAEDAAADPVIDRLIDARLLTSDATLRGEPLIDLAHEALIAGWPQLQHWLLSRRDDEQRRRLLELHAAQWVQRGRGSVGLFDPIELAEAERWIAGDTARELGYSDDLPPFLAASRDAIAESERQRRLAAELQERERIAALEERARLNRWISRLFTVALTLAAIVAVGFGVTARRQRLEAERQRQEAQQQLARNELEQARSLVLERRDALAAIPHLVDAARIGIDAGVLSTVLANPGRELWRVSLHHGGRVNSAAFSPDGARMVTASFDGTARLWDTATGAPLGVPLRHDKAVVSAAFSPDGARVVTTSDDGTARMWDATTGTPLSAPLQHKKMVWSAAFSPDGTRVVTASWDDTARIWDAATGKPLGGPLTHKNIVWSAAFSPDGARVVTASDDGTARLWDAATGRPLTIPLKHKNAVVSAAFSPDGMRVVTASADGTAQVWDAATGSRLGVPLEHGSAVATAAFSPDGTRVVTASMDTARVWSAATGASADVELKHAGLVVSASFSPDGMRVVTASVDRTARVWDLSGQPQGALLRHAGAVVGAAFSSDGARVVTASDDGTARLWDAATGNPLGIPLEHKATIRDAAFSPDGAHVVTASDDGTARLWDTATGNPLGVPLIHDQAVVRAAFSAEGTRVLTASADGTVRAWDAATGNPLGVPLIHDQAVVRAAFSLDGTRVLTAHPDGSAQVWNTTTGAPLGLPLGHAQVVVNAAFSPDGTRVVTSSADRRAQVWDTATGTPLGSPLKHRDEIYRTEFSPDGKRVVTASADGSARVWDAATGTPLSAPLEHPAKVYQAVFSPDGERIVTASADRSAGLWSAATGTPLGISLQHEQEVTSAAFSPDGARLVTADDSGSARVWDAATGHPLSAALQHHETIHSVVFGPGGAQVMTVGSSTVYLWQITYPGDLATWVQQTTRCLAQPEAAGPVRVCELADRPSTAADLVTRAKALQATGDREMHTHTWSIPRRHYLQALSLLDPSSGSAPRLDLAVELRRSISTRLAILDAIEGRVAQARARLGLDASRTDAAFLHDLGRVAHEDLHEELISVALLRRAHEQALDDSGILASLAEVYFATGRTQEFVHAVGQIDPPRASLDVRIAIAALLWAHRRLTHAATATDAHRLLATYPEVVPDAHLAWKWRGTAHALVYGRHRFEDVKPIVDVLERLEEPVSDYSREQLARLLAMPAPPPRRGPN